jgi:hypothetical protein
MAPRKRRRLPTAVRDRLDEAFSAGAAAIRAGHVGFGPGFIDENDLIGIDVQLLSRPLPTRLRNVFPLLLGR